MNKSNMSFLYNFSEKTEECLSEVVAQLSITSNIHEVIPISSTFRSVPRASYQKIPFSGREFRAALLKVLDGDTLSIGLPFSECPLAVKVRLAGLDAPEIPKIKMLSGRIPYGTDKHAGLLVKLCVINLLAVRRIPWDEFVTLTEVNLCNLLLPSITVKLTGVDKYGRYLGDVLIPEENRNSNRSCPVEQGEFLSEYLLRGGFARAYNGEKRIIWEQ